MHTMFTLDFWNDSYYFKQGKDVAFWNDPDEFRRDTGWSFDEVRFVAVETERDIYDVHYVGNAINKGPSQNEIQWLLERVSTFIELGKQQFDQRNPVHTMDTLRNVRLFESDFLVSRHKEQLELGVNTTLSEEEFNQLLTYRQQLRDLGLQYNKDLRWSLVTWPVAPSFAKTFVPERE